MRMAQQYTQLKKTKSLLLMHQASSLPLYTWFNNNFMKVKSDKNHILLSCSEPSTAPIDGSFIESNTKEIFLGITIDRELKFDEQ